VGVTAPSESVASATVLPYRLVLADDSPAGEAVPDEEALDAFRKAAWLQPEEADYHYILGDALLRAGRPGDAAVSFEEATWRDPSVAQYHHALGVALHRVQKFGEAASAFREAVRQQPRQARSHAGLGVALVRLGQPSEALRELRSAVHLEPSSVEANLDLGLALLESGHPDEAVAPLRRAAELAPEDAEVCAHLGAALYATGHDAEAREAFGRALRASPRLFEEHPRLREPYEAASAAALQAQVRSEVERPKATWSFLVLSLLLRAVAALAGVTRSVPRRLAALAGIVLLAVAAHGTVRLASSYMAYYALRDEVAEIALTPVRDDGAIHERLMRAVGKRRLAAYIREGQFVVETGSVWRHITCDYAVPVSLLPGWQERIRFRIDVEKPVIIHDEGRVFF
jgi:Flp pilus assembly protein TadD